MSATDFKKGAWTPEEDERLTAVLKSLPKSEGNCRWSEVSTLIPGRSAKQCRERWCYNLDPTIKKEPWTTEEDEALIKAQKDLGNRWAQIALRLPGRTENSVKTRHKSIMRAAKRAWTSEEDDLILSLHAQIGCRWEKIAERLPLRTKNAVKTRYRLLARGLTEAAPAAGSPEQVLGKVEFDEPMPSNVLPPPPSSMSSPTSVAVHSFCSSKPISTTPVPSSKNKKRPSSTPSGRAKSAGVKRVKRVASMSLKLELDDETHPVTTQQHANRDDRWNMDTIFPFLEGSEYLDIGLPLTHPAEDSSCNTGTNEQFTVPLLRQRRCSKQANLFNPLPFYGNEHHYPVHNNDDGHLDASSQSQARNDSFFFMSPYDNGVY